MPRAPIGAIDTHARKDRDDGPSYRGAAKVAGREIGARQPVKHNDQPRELRLKTALEHLRSRCPFLRLEPRGASAVGLPRATEQMLASRIMQHGGNLIHEIVAAGGKKSPPLCRGFLFG
jgi:hypothetical protein